MAVKRGEWVENVFGDHDRQTNGVQTGENQKGDWRLDEQELQHVNAALRVWLELPVE